MNTSRISDHAAGSLMNVPKSTYGSACLAGCSAPVDERLRRQQNGAGHRIPLRHRGHDVRSRDTACIAL